MLPGLFIWCKNGFLKSCGICKAMYSAKNASIKPTRKGNVFFSLAVSLQPKMCLNAEKLLPLIFIEILLLSPRLNIIFTPKAWALPPLLQVWFRDLMGRHCPHSILWHVCVACLNCPSERFSFFSPGHQFLLVYWSLLCFNCLWFHKKWSWTQWLATTSLYHLAILEAQLGLCLGSLEVRSRQLTWATNYLQPHSDWQDLVPCGCGAETVFPWWLSAGCCSVFGS